MLEMQFGAVSKAQGMVRKARKRLAPQTGTHVFLVLVVQLGVCDVGDAGELQHIGCINPVHGCWVLTAHAFVMLCHRGWSKGGSKGTCWAGRNPEAVEACNGTRSTPCTQVGMTH